MTNVHVLSGFAVRVRHGYYSRRKLVATGTVIIALTAIGQEIALACGTKPTKITGSEKLLMQLSQIYD